MSKDTNESGEVRFVIVTRDSARWILPFLDAYRSIGLEPFYIVDQRSADDTLVHLQDAGADVRVFGFEGHYIEAGPLEFAARALPAACDWTFRIDDDEFPSLALVDWLRGPAKEAATSWAISRREIIRDGDGIAFSNLWSHYHTPSRPDYLNAQVRLYRHREMSYVNKIHTPGFVHDPNGFAPQEAYFIHLDVLLRDLHERIEKLRRYEREVPGSSWKYGINYLPELVPREENLPAALGTSEFDALMNALPLKPEVGSVSLLTSELRKLRAGPFDRTKFGEESHRHLAYLEAEAKRLQGPANQRLGEFLCTISRGAMPLARKHPTSRDLAEKVFRFGSDLQYRARARRAAKGDARSQSPALK